MLSNQERNSGESRSADDPTRGWMLAATLPELGLSARIVVHRSAPTPRMRLTYIEPTPDGGNRLKLWFVASAVEAALRFLHDDDGINEVETPDRSHNAFLDDFKGNSVVVT